MVKNFMSPKAERSQYWNEYLQKMPREELDNLHLKRIKMLMKFAYQNSPLYRRLYDKAGIKPEDIKTLDDFYYKVPFTDKSDFLKDQEEKPFAAEALSPEYRLFYFQTSGTTGIPLREIYSLYDSIRHGDGNCYGFWSCGIRPSDSFYFCFNWGIFAGLWFTYFACRRMGCAVYSGGGMSTQDRISAILNLEPTVIVGTPTYFLFMLEIAKGMGVDLRRAGVRFLIGGGESGCNISAIRKELKEGWGAEVIECYGISEVFSSSECGAHPGGVHVCEDAFHSYSINPETKERVGDGEPGENVVTSYVHTIQPFIKYRTHDLVERYEAFDHGCGWTWAFLKGTVLGRTDHMMVIRGVNVYPTAVESLLGEITGLSRHYELHLTREKGMDRLLVKAEAAPNVSPDQYPFLISRAEEMFKSSLRVKLEVEVVPPKTLPRYELKSKRIFDHRPPEIKGKSNG